MYKGFVPYEMVKDLIELYENRSVYQDWSETYADLTVDIEVQKRLIQKIAKEDK